MYAYIDKGGIMHVVENIKTAEKYKAKGSIIETNIEASHGFPVVGENQIIVYAPDKMKIHATDEDIIVVPKLAEIYKICLNK